MVFFKLWLASLSTTKYIIFSLCRFNFVLLINLSIALILNFGDFEKMKVLITGANGFVGRSLIKYLAKFTDWELRGSARRSDLILPSGVDLVLTGNLSSSTNWEDSVKDVDCIVHTAGRAHIMKSKGVDHCIEFTKVNVDSVCRLAEQAARTGVKRFIFISSIGVNGAETFNMSFSEVSRSQPLTDYARSKFEAEEKLKEICSTSGMEFVIVRPSLVYGESAPGNFGRLLELIYKGVPVPLGSVRNRRSMLGIDNFSDFIRVCVVHPKAANEIFLLADSDDVSTPQLIHLLSEGMEKTSRLYSVPVQLLKLGARLFGKMSMFQQLCGSLQVDISKARNLLDWSPPENIVDGLRREARKYSNKKNI